MSGQLFDTAAFRGAPDGHGAGCFDKLPEGGVLQVLLFPYAAVLEVKTVVEGPAGPREGRQQGLVRTAWRQQQFRQGRRDLEMTACRAGGEKILADAVAVEPEVRTFYIYAAAGQA